ncbi:ARMT1-like domain-containing protein [Desulfatiglans anilini]|uniref:ARMT1-like domain-containing protein n=1 Tax=Desulfatiglans anilini TaxID=90728 RepID=UPI0003FF2D34|nr:ARMT1-like domain-containing protein [Desulfatiglans anilini]
MKPLADCALCTLEWIFGRTASSLDEPGRLELIQTLLGVFHQTFDARENLGFAARETLDAVTPQVVAAAGIYDKIKKESNEAVKALLPAARRFIAEGMTPKERFERACFLAATGNVSPLAAPSGGLTFTETEALMAGQTESPVLMGDVYEAARDRQRVLYLFDNAGEVGFDSLLIEQLEAMGAAVTLVLKEAPFFEDATRADAHFFGLENLSERMLSVKTLLVPGRSTPELERAITECDLILAKGTFNIEATYEEGMGKPVIYMLKIKCGPLSQKLGVPQGRFVVALSEP